MEEDDPMIEDNTEEDDDDFETAERMAMERFGFDSPRGRMPMMRSGRHQSGGSGGNPYRYGYTDVLDEKGEPLAAVTPPEKVVHQKFFNGKS